MRVVEPDSCVFYASRLGILAPTLLMLSEKSQEILTYVFFSLAGWVELGGK
jgi:hypothetical protein